MADTMMTDNHSTDQNNNSDKKNLTDNNNESELSEPTAKSEHRSKPNGNLHEVSFSFSE